MAIREFIENVVRMELIDFIGMVVMADTYSYDASRDNVFYKTDDDVIHVCWVKDIKVPFDEVIKMAMTNKEFFKDIDFHLYIFLVEKDKWLLWLVEQKAEKKARAVEKVNNLWAA